MSKQKYSDEQLTEMLARPEYAGKNNKQIAEMLGMYYTGKLSVRLNQLRRANGLPVSTRGRNNRSEKKRMGSVGITSLPDAEVKPPEPIVDMPKLIPFSFGPKDQVLYDGRLHTVREVTSEKLIMYENATLRRKTVTLEEWNRNPDMVKSTEKKPQHCYEDASRDYPPPKSVEELFEKSPIGRKPATINQDFEDAFKTPEKTEFKQVAERMKAEKSDLSDVRYMPTVESLFAGPPHIDLEIDPIRDEQMDPAYLFDRAPGVEREISETVIGRREYLERIDMLLDIVLPGASKDVLFKAKGLAMSLLYAGIDKEAGNE